MMNVLIVDDSSVARNTVAKALSAEAGICVVGQASNGATGMERFRQLQPDVVVVDLEMPRVDGLEMIDQTRALDARIPIIVFSSFTTTGAELTIESLIRGATDYVAKPPSFGGQGASFEYVRSSLVPKIEALTGRVNSTGHEIRPKPSLTASVARDRAPVQAVGIAASAGGPVALLEVLQAVPGSLEVPIFVAQHMPVNFTAAYAKRIDALCELRVRECTQRERVGPGSVWLAQGGGDMRVERESGEVFVSPSPCRTGATLFPSADLLFSDLAKFYADGALGVVITGMGEDGLRGSEDVVAAGGRVIVQDRQSSVVWGMPGAVTKRELADAVVPLARIAKEIVRRVETQSPPRRGGSV